MRIGILHPDICYLSVPCERYDIPSKLYIELFFRRPLASTFPVYPFLGDRRPRWTAEIEYEICFLSYKNDEPMYIFAGPRVNVLHSYSCSRRPLLVSTVCVDCKRFHITWQYISIFNNPESEISWLTILRFNSTKNVAFFFSIESDSTSWINHHINVTKFNDCFIKPIPDKKTWQHATLSKTPVIMLWSNFTTPKFSLRSKSHASHSVNFTDGQPSCICYIHRSHLCTTTWCGVMQHRSHHQPMQMDPVPSRSTGMMLLLSSDSKPGDDKFELYNSSSFCS